MGLIVNDLGLHQPFGLCSTLEILPNLLTEYDFFVRSKSTFKIACLDIDSPNLQVLVQVFSKIFSYDVPFLNNSLKGIKSNNVPKTRLCYFGHTLPALFLSCAQLIGKFEGVDDSVKYD